MMDLSNERWAEYFLKTDFGTTEYADLIYESLMKTACGYSSGYTIEHILIDAGLAMPRRNGRGIDTTALGDKVLYEFYEQAIK